MKRTIIWLCLIGSFLADAPAAPCAGNYCLEFNGDSSMAVVKPVDGLKSMDGATEFTFEAWIRPRSQGESGRGRILQQINGHIYWYLSDDTRFGFRAGRKAGWRLSNEGAIHYWEWQHIAVSSDGDFMRYFINGKLVRRFRKTITLETTDGDLALGNGFGEDFGNEHRRIRTDVLVDPPSKYQVAARHERPLESAEPFARKVAIGALAGDARALQCPAHSFVNEVARARGAIVHEVAVDVFAILGQSVVLECCHEDCDLLLG